MEASQSLSTRWLCRLASYIGDRIRRRGVHKLEVKPGGRSPVRILVLAHFPPANPPFKDPQAILFSCNAITSLLLQDIQMLENWVFVLEHQSCKPTFQLNFGWTSY